METQGPARVGFRLGGSSTEHPDAERERKRRRRQAEEGERAAAEKAAAAAKAAKEKAKHEVKDEAREDFPKACKERAWLAYWFTEAFAEKSKKVDGVPLPPDGMGHEGVLEEVERVWEPLLPAGMDHTDILEIMHQFVTADRDFKHVAELHARIQEYMLLGDGRLFGQKLSTDAGEITEFLNGKGGGGTRGLEKMDVAVKRLVECAKRKGWVVGLVKRKEGKEIKLVKPEGWPGKLAELLAKDAKKIELIDRAAAASSTFEEVRAAFDEHTKKPDGQPLWSLSPKADRNLATFRGNMSGATKEKYPRSRYAVRVLEVADEKGLLRSLAKYAADQKKLEEDEVYDEYDE